ncbi:MAG: BrnT family toxin [Bdellovibrionaceae bacterium]|nr:BrnT family toxin [Pseudobdellovibrionaceae bacterium]
MRYEWDSSKEKANIKKHGVSFEDAKQALNCGLVVVLKEDTDSGEERYVYLGICKKLNVLVVVVAYPEDEVTRIISARKATKGERKIYEAQL